MMMLSHVVRHRHHLVDADPALVAGAVAVLAADRAVRLPAAVEVLFLEAGRAAAPRGGMLERLLAACTGVRARRCAVIRITDEAMLNGATPMFIRRVRVDGASLVCSVDSTMWPVCAALIAMSAVSRSRISPTMMMSGSWRRNARSAVGERQAGLFVDVDLVHAGQR